jgi:hypothetical protein
MKNHLFMGVNLFGVDYFVYVTPLTLNLSNKLDSPRQTTAHEAYAFMSNRFATLVTKRLSDESRPPLTGGAVPMRFAQQQREQLVSKMCVLLYLRQL